MVPTSCFLIFLVITLLAVENSSRAEDPVRDAVVKIQTTQLTPDYYRPWAKCLAWGYVAWAVLGRTNNFVVDLLK